MEEMGLVSEDSEKLENTRVTTLDKPKTFCRPLTLCGVGIHPEFRRYYIRNKDVETNELYEVSKDEFDKMGKS